MPKCLRGIQLTTEIASRGPLNALNGKDEKVPVAPSESATLSTFRRCNLQALVGPVTVRPNGDGDVRMDKSIIQIKEKETVCMRQRSLQ